MWHVAACFGNEDLNSEMEQFHDMLDGSHLRTVHIDRSPLKPPLARRNM